MKKRWIYVIVMITTIIVLYAPFKLFINFNGYQMKSDSMSHITTKIDSEYEICGEKFNQKTNLNLDEYWKVCGKWYENKSISKEQFSNFPINNGFSKGAILIVEKKFEPKLGDVILFSPNLESTSLGNIPHRIISIKNGIYSTKGDHNIDQLKLTNNVYRTDETNIQKNQIIAKVDYIANFYTMYLYFFIISILIGFAISYTITKLLKK